MTHLDKWSVDFEHIFMIHPPPSRVQGRQPLRAPEAKRRARCVANATTTVRAFRNERQRMEKSELSGSETQSSRLCRAHEVCHDPLCPFHSLSNILINTSQTTPKFSD